MSEACTGCLCSYWCACDFSLPPAVRRFFVFERGLCRLERHSPRSNTIGGLQNLMPVPTCTSLAYLLFLEVEQQYEEIPSQVVRYSSLHILEESERLWTVLLKVLAPYQMSLKFLLRHCKKVMGKRQNRIFTCPIQVIGRFFSV